MASFVPRKTSYSSTEQSSYINDFRNSLQEEKKLANHKSLNKFGRKKTVSFSTNISIINVENWKKFNIDVSEKGCWDWDIKKNEEKRRKEEEEERRKRKEEKDGCQCTIW